MAFSFPTLNPDQETDFFNKYGAWQAKVLEHYKWLKRADPAAGQSMNLGDILRSLPKQRREAFMSQFRELIGFDTAITDETVRWFGRPKTRGSVAKLLVDHTNASAVRGAGANPMAVILNNMSVQFNEKTGRLGFGANIPTAEYAKSLVEDARGLAPIQPGKRMLVWDTETTGLMKESGIRQISAIDVFSKKGPSGTTLDVAKSMTHDIHFRTARMQWGYLSDRGANTRRMSDVIEQMIGGPDKWANAVPGSGDDFASALIPFLESLHKADYIAGQNIQFDIDQVLVGLKHSAIYHDNQAVKSLVKKLTKKLRDPSIIRDTLARSKAVLPNLKVARELELAGERRPYSLENVLLQTNLAELIREDVGGDAAFRKMFGIAKGGALHAADIDTRLTAYLAKFLYEPGADGKLRIKAQRLGATGDKTMATLRRMALKSSAFTPMTNLTDISYIDRDVFAGMFKETLAGGDSIRVMQKGFDIKKLAAKHGADAPSKLYDILSKGNAPFARFKMSPIEQEIIKDRKNLDSGVSPAAEDLILNLGKWRDFTRSGVRNKGFLNNLQDLFQRGTRPPAEAFDTVRRSMAEAGIPFAGLSQPERWITHSMALAGTRKSEVARLMGGTLESKVARIGDDLGVSRFAAQKAAFVSASGESVSLPVSLLRRAHDEGIISEVGGLENGLGLSAFEYSDRRQVNLIHNFTDADEAQRFGEWIRGQDLGLDSIYHERLATAIESNGYKNGIGIGYLDKDAGHAAYEAVESINQGLISDRSSIPFRAALLPGEADDDILRVGAFRLQRMLGSADHEAYKRSLQSAADLSRGLEDLAKAKPGFFAAASELVDFAPNTVAQRALKAAEAVSEHSGAIAGVSAVLGLGYYINKRRKKQNEYDATLSPQSMETPDDYAAYRKQMGLSSASIRKGGWLSSLATAGVVGNMDRVKSGHTQMGNNKYSHLYGV